MARKIASIPVEYRLSAEKDKWWLHYLYRVFIGDLDNDGEYEYLLCAGDILQIAYKGNGKVLWRYEDSNGRASDIRPASDVPIYDIDGDHRAEVVVPRLKNNILHLVVLDGATGQEKCSCPYPHPEMKCQSDTRGFIVVADFGDSDGKMHLVAGFDYMYAAVFDSKLNFKWERVLGLTRPKWLDLFTEIYGTDYSDIFTGHGHTPRVVDIDHCGRDEIIFGATVLRHDGSLLWSRGDLFRRLPPYRGAGPAQRDLTGNHVDSVAVGDFNEDGDQEVFFSSGAVMVDKNGRLLWTKGMDYIVHGQTAMAGKWMQGKGRQLFLLDQRGRLATGAANPIEGRWVFDKSGDMVNVYSHGGELIRTFPGGNFSVGDWNGDGLDELLLLDQSGNRLDIIDGEGKIIDRIDNWGKVKRIIAVDLNGDACVEVLAPTWDEKTKTARIDIYGQEKQKKSAVKSSCCKNTKSIANMPYT